MMCEPTAELAEAEALRGYDAVHLAAALLVGATILSPLDEITRARLDQALRYALDIVY